MVVDAKHGLLGDGRIRVDGRRSRVTKDSGGWYVVADPSSWGEARVLYNDYADLAVLRWSTTILRVHFKAGEGAFSWEERSYHIGTMIEGEVRIDQEGRSVVRGHATVSGIHLDTVATELLPIIRPLTWALVLRSEAVAFVGRGVGVPTADAAIPPPSR